MNSHFVRRLALTSLLIFFPLLIFSYYPLISFGSAFGVHLDISLLYGALIIVFAATLPILWRKQSLLASSLTWKVGLLFILYIWLSFFWSSNPFRAFVTASFFTLVFGIVSAIIVQLPELSKHKHTILRLTAYSFGLAGILALWQITADALHAPNALSLLPATYSGDTFGIARPTAFALEPQFFGSLLLIPLLYTSYGIMTRPSKLQLSLFSLSAFLLLLTLSRGALLAGCIGLALLIVLVRPKWQVIVKLLVTGTVTVLVTLICIGIVGTLRHDTISGYATAKNVINQLSLGTVSLPEEAAETSSSTSQPSTESGYVESSTSSRISMSSEAITLWNSSPLRILFGVGIGGFGASLQAIHPEAPDSSVVNNFYLELLAETGIIGAALLLSFLSVLVYSSVKKRQFLLLSLLIAFLVQWCFFSGISNVVHVWVIFGLIAAVGARPLKHTFITRPV